MKGHDNGLEARVQAIARSGGKCQFCGIAEAEEAHHWEYPKYTRESKLKPDHLTALCKPCHQLATFIRRAHTHGHSIDEFHSAVTMLVERLFK